MGLDLESNRFCILAIPDLLQNFSNENEMSKQLEDKLQETAGSVSVCFQQFYEYFHLNWQTTNPKWEKQIEMEAGGDQNPGKEKKNGKGTETEAERNRSQDELQFYNCHSAANPKSA